MPKPPPRRPLHGFDDHGLDETPGPGPVHDGVYHAKKHTADLHNSRSGKTAQKADHLHSHQQHAPQRETEGKDVRGRKTGLGARIKTEIKGAVAFTIKVTIRVTISISVTISVTGVAANNKQVDVLWNRVKQSDYIPPVIVDMVDNVHGWTKPFFVRTYGSPPAPRSHNTTPSGPPLPSFVFTAPKSWCMSVLEGIRFSEKAGHPEFNGSEWESFREHNCQIYQLTTP
jgi:hypothetical protein